MAKSSRNRKTRSRQSNRKSSKGARSAGSTTAASQAKRKADTSMVLSSRNYQLMILGVALVVIGYTMMRIENEVDGIISLYVAPLIILGGYLEIIYAILWQPKVKVTEADESVEVAVE